MNEICYNVLFHAYFVSIPVSMEVTIFERSIHEKGKIVFRMKQLFSQRNYFHG